MDLEERVRRYASEVTGGGPLLLTASVERFEAGNRHAVYRVSSGDIEDATGAVVVRVSLSDAPAERAQAEREAMVLKRLGGAGAPSLYDFQAESRWFRAPAMCMQFVDGDQRELSHAGTDDVERLGAVVASIHNVSIDDFAPSFGGATTLATYVDERLALTAAYRPRLRNPLPPSAASRVEHAFALVEGTSGLARREACFRSDDGLVLLHGDVADGNILWASEPVLIDWEYTRLGDPADEVAYIFGQHGLTVTQREAFWAGYRRATDQAKVDHMVERASWWEPVLLLGSALWWLERWSRSANAEDAAVVDPFAPKPPSYYLDQATRRLDRFDGAITKSL